MTDTVPSVPVADAKPGTPMAEVNEFLDKHVLPYPVKFLTNRITILATLCLLVPLIILANVTVFVLGANSYLNVMSVVVSSTVLLYSTLSESRDRVAAQRREEIAAWHDKMMDESIQQIRDHLDDIHGEVMQHISTSLDNIQKLLVERMEQMQAEDHAQIEQTNTNLGNNIQAHREELIQLKNMMEALRPPAPGQTK